MNPEYYSQPIGTADEFIAWMDEMHPNAAVAWDRDIHIDIVMPKAQRAKWLGGMWDGGVSEGPLRSDGLGCVWNFKLPHKFGRAVLIDKPDDILGCQWIVC